MKAQEAGAIAVVEASWVRPEAERAWESRMQRSGVRTTPGWTTIRLGEEEGRRLLLRASHSPDYGASWIVDPSGCVVRAGLGAPIARRVLASLLRQPQACGGAGK